jgi:tRNA A-37 threonylcarbamoyl transferase component Bud32
MESFPKTLQSTQNANEKRNSEMSIEEVVQEIDFILDHHEQLRARWEELIAGLSLNEQLSKLKELAQRRREKTVKQPYISEKLRVLKELPPEAEAFFTEALQYINESTEVDRGFNGKIMEYQKPDGDEASIVYKILIRSPIGEQNDLLSEASYLADLYAFTEAQRELQIGAPRPYYCASLTNARVIAMEKVPGISIENILVRGIELPNTLDLDLIEERLHTFIERMNAIGLYHNDLRTGNIMINIYPDPSSPIAYVIDTGSTKRIYGADIPERHIDNHIDHGMLRQSFERLRNYQARQLVRE